MRQLVRRGLACWLLGVILISGTACTTPKPQPALVEAERTRPACAEHIAFAPGQFLEDGHAPDARLNPVRRFLYEIADSTWCATVTPQDLLDTARSMIDQYPQVCSDPGATPESEILAFIDARTGGGPVAAAFMGAELTVGRSGVYQRFHTSAGELLCQN
ncbi:hypothetical protein [Nocardia sp. NPDC051832]|uniref:hypothetical protein n=1 Tax=Nocardia sp. NPDC051832 TaxID=3155673 RepID=UPI00343DE5E9